LIKWLGAAYLMWMGVRLLKTPAHTDGEGSSENPALQTGAESENRSNLKAVFLKAFATNALNPKVALFFLAFVPQFIPASAPDPVWTFLLLGCLFVFDGLLICMAWALAASWLSKRASLLQLGLRKLDRLAGLMFVGFGLKLAMTDAPVH
jgi:threonine/homoserine/homoserine lactone efflux protein